MNTEEFERLLKSNEVAVDVSPEQLLRSAKHARTRRRVVGTAVTAAVLVVAAAVSVPAWQSSLREPEMAGTTSPSASAVPVTPTPSPSATSAAVNEPTQTSAPASTEPAKVAPPAVCQVAWPGAWEQMLSDPAKTGRYEYETGVALDGDDGAFTWEGVKNLTFGNSQYFVDADATYLVTEQSAGEAQALFVYEQASGREVFTTNGAFASPFKALADGRLLYVQLAEGAIGGENAPNSSYAPATASHEVALLDVGSGTKTVMASVPANAAYHVALLSDAVLVNGQAYDFAGQPTTVPDQPAGATDRSPVAWASATQVWRTGWNAPLTYPGGAHFSFSGTFVLTDLQDGSYRLLDSSTGAQATLKGVRAWLTRHSLVVQDENGEFRQATLDSLAGQATC